jgi:uracil-DNA glycosylase family 4
MSKGEMTKARLKGILEFYKAMGIAQIPRVVPEKTKAGKTSFKGEIQQANFPAPGKRESKANTSGPNEKIKDLSLLREKIGDCKGCKLASGRTNLVFGEGNPDAEILFIGEAPGREEDLQGRPFVGDAGKLLTSLIERMGFKREDVFIGNIIKCRPPLNRDPEEDEIAACIPFIKEQIKIIAPKVIVSLGRVSAQTLIETKVQISKLRGKFFEYEGVPLMPTFHPAYLLRNRSEKWKTWEDAMMVLEFLGRKRPE